MSIELSAIKTLDKLGYTYHGDGVWKEPKKTLKELLQPSFVNAAVVKHKEIDRTTEKAERLNEIAHWFDFKKVSDVMQFLGWQWRSSGVPTEEEIRSFCLSVVTDVYNKTCATMTSHSYDSGGFFIQSNIEDDDTISISVKFVLTDWDAFTPE